MLENITVDLSRLEAPIAHAARQNSGRLREPAKNIELYD